MNRIFTGSIFFLFITFNYSIGQAKLDSIGAIYQRNWPPVVPVDSVQTATFPPYLSNKPSSISINIGRQLFVDDFLIYETTLDRVNHQPSYYPNNPILEPDKSWEQTAEGWKYAAPFSDGVWYDDQQQKFKMWYLSGGGIVHKNINPSYITCYAESEDGINWVKPDLDIVPGTNIVDTAFRDAATIWLDKNASNQNKRWVMAAYEKRPNEKKFQCVLKYSVDGIHWSKGIAQSGDVGDRSSLFYNPFHQKWVMSLRGATNLEKRARFYVENSDIEDLVSVTHAVRTDVKDKNIFYWFSADNNEIRHEQYPAVKPGIYNFDVIAYESIMLGQYTV